MQMSNFDNKHNESRLTRLETLYEGISCDINEIKLSINGHIKTLSIRTADLEKEMSKRWSRPEAITLGLMMSIITALTVYIITK
jgi:hypothetical protein